MNYFLKGIITKISTVSLFIILFGNYVMIKSELNIITSKCTDLIWIIFFIITSYWLSYKELKE